MIVQLLLMLLEKMSNSLYPKEKELVPTKLQWKDLGKILISIVIIFIFIVLFFTRF